MLDLIRQRAQSWGVKIAFGIIIIVFVFWGVGNMGQSGPNVVATINGRPITMQELMAEVTAQENQIRAMIPDFSSEDMRALQIPQQSLQILASRALVEQEAERIGMTVTPVELFAYLRDVPNFKGPDGKFDQATYEKALADAGRDVASFEQSMMREVLREKMRQHVSAAVSVSPDEAKRRFAFQSERRVISYVLFATEEYSQDIAVTDEMIKTYYDQNQPQFARPATTAISFVSVTPATLASSMEVTDTEIDAAFNAGPLRYNLRQILTVIPVDADETAVLAAREQLNALAGQVRAGKEFSEVAAEAAKIPATNAGELGWIDARQLPEDVLAALAGLKKGEMTTPVRTGDRISVFQLVETNPEYSLPETEIKAAFRASLAEQKAALHFRDVQAQAEDLVAEGKPLKDIAQELKGEIVTTNAASREDLAYLLGLRKPSQVSTISGPKGTLVPAILETREGFAIAEIAEQNEAGVTPLEEVTDRIRDIIVRREAEKRAEEAARAALPEFGDDAGSFQPRVVSTEPFGRSGEVPGLGFSRLLTDAAFSAPVGKWLQTPFATPAGAVIAKPVEIVSITDEEWDSVKDRVIQGLLEAKQSQVFSAFIADAGKNAKFSVTNPQFFEQTE